MNETETFSQRSETPLVELREVNQIFWVEKPWIGKAKPLYALRNVSLHIPKGSSVGLVGESGCGKSTLGKVILQLTPQASGSVFFRGQDISNWSQKKMRPLRRHMQMIFQDPYSSLHPKRTILQNLQEPFLIHNEIENMEEKIHQLLQDVGLDPETLHRYPHELSGGQCQRVCIARAVSVRPDFIVADESVSALDVSIRGQILHLFLELKTKYQLTYLFISHDLAVIEVVSDFVAVMYLGQIVEWTSAKLLFANPLHPYTQLLLEAIPIPVFRPDRRKRHQFVEGELPDPVRMPPGCPFAARCSKVQPHCRETAPALRNLGTSETSHYVACHEA